MRQKPDRVLAVLDAEMSSDEAVNWELLRELASNRAIDAVDVTEKKGWATVADRAATNGRSAGSDDATTSWAIVSLKAHLIAQLGAQPGDPILGLDLLLTWFVEQVDGIDPETTWALATTPVELLRSGRRIKNALAALAPVIEDPRYGRAPELALLRQWWDRRDTLP